ncbi:RrF2 family transcriptional regulator [Thermus thermamylovorans]|uniref:Rrf2 family transcriptional regulator n=1 Tax=Thermus thermamylovorans TaxID=2509362 RepID=A0A4Q9B3E5_9DEIN|nr:Rrf2 family transcriptional regulator [Thermus thermamylovorans]TBH20054.1 Rrf2 family transcriptional regulator [Thermus thermamylovorans]
MPVRSLLRREESYALHALLLLAEEPGLGAAEIARKLKAPPAFLAKVLSKLTKAGLVESRMGRAGGVWLRLPPEEITLLKVMESLSGPVALDLCATLRRCPTEERRGFCYLKPNLVRMNQEIRRAFSSLTLKDLLPEAPKRA